MTTWLEKKRSYQKEKGMTMIVAVVIMAILIVFTFSLTLIAYSLYSSQNKNLSSMKCAEAANTLVVALADELCYEDAATERYPEYDSYLYKYIRYNLFHSSQTWPYYKKNDEDHNATKACRYFDLNYNTKKKVYDENGEEKKQENEEGEQTSVNVDHVEGLPGKTVVCIFWELPSGATTTQAEGDVPVAGTKLTIEVTCEAASQTYTAKKEFLLEIRNYKSTTVDAGLQLNLKNSASNNAVNPCSFSYETEIHPEQRWVWIPAE